MTDPPSCRVLILLPQRDFDPSEVAVTWKILTGEGHRVVFATPDGLPASADPLMLGGEGLDLWGRIPILRKIKLLGLLLRANADARRAYALMQKSPAFLHPLRYVNLALGEYDALVLPGGHWARGMRQYLEDAFLQRFVADFFDADKPVAAICHGVVLAARSISPRTGKSVLFGRKTTALTWTLEKAAWSTMRFFGRVWDPDYYRTYSESNSEPAGYRGVQAEVTRALASPTDFRDVPDDAAHHFRKASGLFRDSSTDQRPAWVVRDGRYVSARWPGDVHAFAKMFAAVVAEPTDSSRLGDAPAQGQKAPAAPGNTTGLSKPSAETLDTPKAKSSMATLTKVSDSALPASRECVHAGSVVSRQ
jgi:putative intracellular protease/amidase